METEFTNNAGVSRHHVRSALVTPYRQGGYIEEGLTEVRAEDVVVTGPVQDRYRGADCCEHGDEQKYCSSS